VAHGAALGGGVAARSRASAGAFSHFTDAKLIVGTHDYVVGSLPWAVKMAASLVGFSGNKERGIEELYAASKGGGEASIDAKILLALFLRREGALTRP